MTMYKVTITHYSGEREIIDPFPTDQIVDAADPDTMLVEDEEGSLIRTTDKYFEP